MSTDHCKSFLWKHFPDYSGWKRQKKWKDGDAEMRTFESAALSDGHYMLVTLKELTDGTVLVENEQAIRIKW